MKEYLISRNEAFRNLPQWVYLIIISIIGMNFNIILFFWGLKSVGAIITSTGFIISLLFVSFVNHYTLKEEVSGFKILYISILIVALIILGVISNNMEKLADNAREYSESTPSKFGIGTVLLMIVYGFSLFLFIFTGDMDTLTKKESLYSRENSSYRSVRSFFKVSLIMLFSAVTLIPLLKISGWIIDFRIGDFPLFSGASKDDIMAEIEGFFAEIRVPDWWYSSWSLNGIALNILFTIVPYVLYYDLAEKWVDGNSFNLWEGVLQILEPIVNIIIGLYFLNESFPSEWLGVIILLLLISIIVKYISETQAQIHAILLIKLKNAGPPLDSEVSAESSGEEGLWNIQDIIDALYRIPSIRSVSSIIGQYDLYCKIRAPTYRYFTDIMYHRIGIIPRIDSYSLLIVTEEIVR